MKSFKTKLTNKGFTLMEVMAAFAILTISLLLLATLFLTATRMIARGNEIKDQGNSIFASIESGIYESDVEALLNEYTIIVKIKEGNFYRSFGKLEGYKNIDNEFVENYAYTPTDDELTDEDVDVDEGRNLPRHVGDEIISPNRGVYKSGYNYKIGDFFLYNGSYYKVLKNSTTYYEPGNPSAKFLYKMIRFEYDQQSSYESGDVVRSGKNYYRSLSWNDEPNEKPLSDIDWEEVIPEAGNLRWIQKKR